MKDKIKQLLGDGHPASVVAAAIGCSEGYISQLLAQEEFRAEVQQLKLSRLGDNTARDGKYDKIEDKLLAKLDEAADMIYKPQEILRALKITNEAKRRGGMSAGADVGAGQNNLVRLNMPVFVQQNFILNAKSEVVEVAGRSLATINAKELAKELMQDATPAGQHDASSIHNVTRNANRIPPRIGEQNEHQELGIPHHQLQTAIR
jgi:hypothetical protein